MLDQSTNLIERNSTSKMPLLFAIEAETTAIPESSIKRGADMYDLRIALLRAAEAVHGNILRLLLDYGARFGSIHEEFKARESLSRAGTSEKDPTEEKL